MRKGRLMNRFDAWILVIGLALIVLASLGGCDVNDNGLSTETPWITQPHVMTRGNIQRPDPRPDNERNADANFPPSDAGTGVETDTNSIPAQSDSRVGTLSDSAIGAVDVPGCSKGAVYPCETGLCPCPN
jgi:hypothetical protein